MQAFLVLSPHCSQTQPAYIEISVGWSSEIINLGFEDSERPCLAEYIEVCIMYMYRRARVSIVLARFVGYRTKGRQKYIAHYLNWYSGTYHNNYHRHLKFLYHSIFYNN